MFRTAIAAIFVAAALITTTTQPAPAQEAHREILAAKYQEALDEIAWELPGVMGIAVIDLAADRVYGVNEGLVFPQGSAIKVSVLVAMYVRQARGEMDVDQPVAIRAEERVGGSGYIRHFGDGTSSLSLHDLAVMMITVSDNMATNMLIDRVGMENVTAIMAELGLPDTRLQRKMIRQEQSARGNENLSTPLQAATLMRRILECDLPMPADDCREMQAVLAIPHAGPIQDGTGPGVRVLQKTGSIAGVRTSWGVVDLEGRPYALAVMGNYGETPEISAEIETVAALSYWYFTRLAGATEYGTRVPVDLLERIRRRQPR